MSFYIYNYSFNAKIQPYVKNKTFFDKICYDVINVTGG